MPPSLRAYLIDRAREPFTWRGLVMVATGLGVGFAPQSIEAIVAAGTLIAGAIGAATPDPKEPKK